MDSLQEQIAGLSTRVDALHQVIDRLNERIAIALPEVGALAGVGQNSRVAVASGFSRHINQHRADFDTAMEHKDVLTDDGYFDSESQSGDRELTADIQVQRLTAQLTAAYNRIAALEEQLLSHRFH